MKKYIIFLICLVLSQNIYSQNKFTWGLGSIGIQYDIIHDARITQGELLKFTWINTGVNIGLGFSLFDITIEDTDIKYSLLPVELLYSPWNYNDSIFLFIYSKASWRFVQKTEVFTRDPFTNFFSPTNNFYGAVGTRLSFYSPTNANSLFFSYYGALFIEYTSMNELKIGVQLDLPSVLFGIIKSKTEAEQKKRDNPFSVNIFRNRGKGTEKVDD